MHGHGRTADTDRPMSFTTLGDDIAVLLDHLEIPKADLVGHSFGGASAIRAAMAENMMQTPTGKSSKQWPEPQRFLQFLDKMGNTVSEDYYWSADIATLPM